MGKRHLAPYLWFEFIEVPNKRVLAGFLIFWHFFCVFAGFLTVSQQTFEFEKSFGKNWVLTVIQLIGPWKKQKKSQKKDASISMG